jgi:hypothetical protein
MSKNAEFGDAVMLMACCILLLVHVELYTLNSHLQAGRKSSPTAHISAQKSFRKDDRPFAQFMRDEGLIEVVGDWKIYLAASPVVIKGGGELWM